MLRSLLAFSLGLCGLVSSAHADDPVEVKREGKQIVVSSKKRVILRYQAEPGELPVGVKDLFLRGGYIAQIFSPAGKLVTDDFPPNHLHHHGVWSAWTKTEFEGRKPDFWNMGDGTGRVDFVEVDEMSSGEKSGSFKVRHQFVDLSAKPSKVVLLETWLITIRTDGKSNVIDYTSVQRTAGNAALKLPEYHYGGIGFRGNRAWDEASNCRFLTATGLTDRKKVNASKENWCWVGGQVDGELAGVTFFCSPGNFRAPQAIRAHPTEPFFCYAPQQGGEMSIEPGKDYNASYRLLVRDGEPDAKMLDQQWQEYSKAAK